MKTPFRPLPFVLVSTGHGTMIVNRNDFHMVNATQGYGVGHQLFQTGYFDPAEVAWALELLDIRRELHGPGVVAIDGGANIGVHTLEWAKHMTGWGRVLAFEAQERIFYALAGNVAINNCFNATLHHAALGAQLGQIHIPKPDHFKPASFGSLELRQRENNEFIGQRVDYTPEHSEPVQMLTLDSLGLKRLDFIKLDIEGMELEALSGAAATLTQHKPLMLIETIKTDATALHRFLDQHGYQLFPMGINVMAVHASDPCLARIRKK
jgi:FkbM family methyltransferase